MKVSVIVPVYNVQQYLKQCVDSLLHQTFKNLEIILVNDGSKDSSGAICDELKKCNPDVIKVIHKTNQGLGYARNSGLDIATGEFVTFIDSDDYADENMIGDLVKVAENEDADVVIGGFKRVNNSGDIIFIEQYEDRIYSGKEIVNSLFMRMLGSNPRASDAIKMSVWNALYSMDVIRKNAIRFPSERELISEDIIFDSEFYPCASKAVLIKSTAYNYRVSNSSLTGSYRTDRFEKTMVLYNELYKRIQHLKMSPEAVYRIQRQLFVNVRICLRQENKKVSGVNYSQALKNIKRICSDVQLRGIISEYPVHSLGLKQRLFLILLKEKMTWALLACAQLKLL